MNNAALRLITEEPSDDRKSEVLGKREAELIRVMEALSSIQRTKEWSSLKEIVFDGLKQNLEIRLLAAAREAKPDTHFMSNLSGQLVWAEKFSDLSKLEGTYRLELSNVRKQLYGSTES